MNSEAEATARDIVARCQWWGFDRQHPENFAALIREITAALAASRAEGEGQAEQCHAALTEVGIPELVRVGHAVEVLSARGRIFLLAGQRNEAKAECDTLRVQLGGAERLAAALRAKLRMMASEAESVNRRDLDAIADAPFSRDLLRRCYVTLTETEAAAQAHDAAVAQGIRERDCKAICKRCTEDQAVFEMNPGEWWHGERSRVEQYGGHRCYASNIRALRDDGLEE